MTGVKWWPCHRTYTEPYELGLEEEEEEPVVEEEEPDVDPDEPALSALEVEGVDGVLELEELSLPDLFSAFESEALVSVGCPLFSDWVVGSFILSE